MQAVILRHTKDPSQTIELASGELTMGRASSNHICINDASVSTNHARIFTYFCVSYVEDLNSTNGTYVNGKRIKKHLLKPGDDLRLGKYSFIVELPYIPQSQQSA